MAFWFERYMYPHRIRRHSPRGARVARYRGPVSFSPDVVAAVLHHMNDDHLDDNLLIVRAFAGETGADAVSATMTALDGAGGTWAFTDAAGDEHTVDVPWPGAPIAERAEIRREVVVLYDAACERLGITPREH